jgi:hypothetical protein
MGLAKIDESGELCCGVCSIKSYMHCKFHQMHVLHDYVYWLDLFAENNNRLSASQLYNNIQMMLFRTFARASWLLSLFIFMLYSVLRVRFNNNNK